MQYHMKFARFAMPPIGRRARLAEAGGEEAGAADMWI
jgi:hypothetical protein